MGNPGYADYIQFLNLEIKEWSDDLPSKLLMRIKAIEVIKVIQPIGLMFARDGDSRM